MNVQMNFRIPENIHTALKVRTAGERTSVSKYLAEVFQNLVDGNLEVDLRGDEETIKTTTAVVDHEVRDRLETYAKEHNVPVNRLVRLAIEASLAHH